MLSDERVGFIVGWGSVSCVRPIALYYTYILRVMPA